MIAILNCRDLPFVVKMHDPRVQGGLFEIHVWSGADGLEDGMEYDFGKMVEASVCGALELGWAWVEEKELGGVSFMEM